MSDSVQETTQDPVAVEFYKAEREYKEKTDKYIEQAEHFLDLYVQQLTRDYGSDDFIWPDSDVARVCELSCQVAKARGLRNGL